MANRKLQFTPNTIIFQLSIIFPLTCPSTHKNPHLIRKTKLDSTILEMAIIHMRTKRKNQSKEVFQEHKVKKRRKIFHNSQWFKVIKDCKKMNISYHLQKIPKRNQKRLKLKKIPKKVVILNFQLITLITFTKEINFHKHQQFNKQLKRV